ncbi:hypothetical protein BYT27DRAFT_7218381 [Phlegmacium glaucopus]|nr:hypothetical protein BYT27DRAFT_7218381 [Phlegmacium glaucopus]
MSHTVTGCHLDESKNGNENQFRVGAYNNSAQNNAKNEQIQLSLNINLLSAVKCPWLKYDITNMNAALFKNKKSTFVTSSFRDGTDLLNYHDSSAITRLAEKYKGLAILWEHRFYGASLFPKMPQQIGGNSSTLPTHLLIHVQLIHPQLQHVIGSYRELSNNVFELGGSEGDVWVLRRLFSVLQLSGAASSIRPKQNGELGKCCSGALASHKSIVLAYDPRSCYCLYEKISSRD